MERKQLAPGVFLTTLDAHKFNRCRITVHLRFPACRASATDAAVLPLVLERGYAACPDMTALSRRLAELYGADMGVDLGTAGTDRVLTADICGIKDAFALGGENLTAAYADIVLGTIFDPYLVDGLFDPEAVRIEKETLARRLQAEYNNKRLYCVRQARRRFYGDSPAGVELGGYLADLPAVTPATLKAEYDRILATASIDVMVQGADADRVAQMVLVCLSHAARAPHPFAAPVAMPRTPVAHYTEKIPALTQAKLCMLFTSGTAGLQPSLNVLRMAMGVFGGTVTSRLFRNVREKQSLCYYCGSSAQRALGVMMVDSGVEPGQEAQAEAAILQEWEALKNGPITDEELDDCRRALLSGMESLGDTLSGLENWYYGQIARGEQLLPPRQAMADLKAVTADEVRAVLQSYSYSVCYTVTAGEGHADA
ncbi:MAG: M16 family metallopeptidase [Gemmiger sp.]